MCCTTAKSRQNMYLNWLMLMCCGTAQVNAYHVYKLTRFAESVTTRRFRSAVSFCVWKPDVMDMNASPCQMYLCRRAEWLFITIQLPSATKHCNCNDYNASLLKEVALLNFRCGVCVNCPGWRMTFVCSNCIFNRVVSWAFARNVQNYYYHYFIFALQWYDDFWTTSVQLFLHYSVMMLTRRSVS